MVEDPLANLADRLLTIVRKDAGKLDTVLEEHGDVREELEPILTTAMRVDSVKHPAIPADARRDIKEKALASSATGPPGAGGASGPTPPPPPQGPK